ncbi:hypothetical protein COU58_00635 [Candidatus Pacearchaeota archaeon CG10_big_fil_rev_8_21_14_0_10_32_42]|nr:MAG: hypothetical protein COU58_00635 [Candidatus Pacearchaeota archaeon CG10_big_fil_rev_8_21_14_0_10_32_42]
MLKKFLIVGSKADTASWNIVVNLMDLGNFEFHIIDGDMLDTRNLDRDKISNFDFVIFVSKHKSEKGGKTLSIHAPGNFKEVWGGGEVGELSFSSALFQKHLFLVLKKIKEESELIRYSITLEATHHGPLIEKPSVFIEIGGSEEEWKDKKASFVIAKAVREAIDTWKENPYYEVAVGIGGPHYCPTFNKLQLNSNVAFSHIIPKYVSPITENMILELIKKTIEEVDFAVLDWKGLGKAEERDEVIRILEKNYIMWKKNTDIKY